MIQRELIGGPFHRAWTELEGRHNSSTDRTELILYAASEMDPKTMSYRKVAHRYVLRAGSGGEFWQYEGAID